MDYIIKPVCFSYNDIFIFNILSQDKMSKTENQQVPTQSQTQISQQFFAKIPELTTIQQKFALSSIDHQLAVRDIENEFQLIRAITETKKHKMKLRTNSVIQNKKNRYPEQSIFDHSRIHIQTSTKNPKITPSQSDALTKNKQKSDYINANYVFKINLRQQQKQQQQHITIITQAPLLETLPQFISMIVNNDITCVVMLCNVIQNGKNRCYDYLHQGDLFQSVCLVGGAEGEGVQVRKIVVCKGTDTDGNQQFHQFYHILFTEWPDKSVPDTPAAIQPIINLCAPHTKIVIHCSAGLGRSGVVATIHEILKDLNRSENKDHKKLSIFGVVRCLRQDRYGAVQNNQQYKFIYEYFSYYFKKQKQLHNQQN